MPTAKLSRQFYQRFGDRLVNELVELLNQMDAAFKTEVREQGMLTYAKFEAKLEQRLAEFAEQLDHRFDRFEDRIEKRFGLVEKRLDQQGRLFILAWVTLIAAVVGMGLR